MTYQKEEAHIFGQFIYGAYMQRYRVVCSRAAAGLSWFHMTLLLWRMLLFNRLLELFIYRETEKCVAGKSKLNRLEIKLWLEEF